MDTSGTKNFVLFREFFRGPNLGTRFRYTSGRRGNLLFPLCCAGHQLYFPVMSVIIIGVMWLSYNERAVPDGRFQHHLFQAVFMRTTYPSRCVYFGRSSVHTAVESAVTAPVGM